MTAARNTLYNLVGLGAPLAAALFSIPYLIHGLGESRFGVLTLIWSIVGYFGMLDLGIGRSLTLKLSQCYSDRDYMRAGHYFATATLLMGLLGVVAGIGLWFAGFVLNGTPTGASEQTETWHSIIALAMSMPTVILASAFRGVLEARHQFFLINLIRLPMGVYNFVAPVAVIAMTSPRLDYVAYSLAIGRALACLFYAWGALLALRADNAPVVFRPELVKPLLYSGGWMTVSSLVASFMSYIDRFMIMATASAVAVAYYATPQEMITKIWIIPGALTAVLFPTFSSLAFKDAAEVARLYRASLQYLFWIIFPITLLISYFAHLILSLWVGDQFAANSYRVLQIFSLGILINCLAHVPFTLLQSLGKARAVALLNIIELPFFIVLLWALTINYGVYGASIAWSLRMLVDALALFYMSRSTMKWRTRGIVPYKLIAKAALVISSFGVVIFH